MDGLFRRQQIYTGVKERTIPHHMHREDSTKLFNDHMPNIKPPASQVYANKHKQYEINNRRQVDTVLKVHNDYRTDIGSSQRKNLLTVHIY
jgi:hypothetical protein